MYIWGNSRCDITGMSRNLYLGVNVQISSCNNNGFHVIWQVNTTTNKVRFHSVDLQLVSVRLQVEDGSKDVPIKISICNQSESVCLDVEGTALQSGCKYVLSVKFNGVLDNNLRGFYKAQYTRYSTSPYLSLRYFFILSRFWIETIFILVQVVNSDSVLLPNLKPVRLIAAFHAGMNLLSKLLLTYLSAVQVTGWPYQIW